MLELDLALCLGHFPKVWVTKLCFISGGTSEDLFLFFLVFLSSQGHEKPGRPGSISLHPKHHGTRQDA